MTKQTIINAILAGDNYPPSGKIVFDSSDHVRFQNGRDVSEHIETTFLHLSAFYGAFEFLMKSTKVFRY